jgi:A/G-specific adenine glycosylase
VGQKALDVEVGDTETLVLLELVQLDGDRFITQRRAHVGSPFARLRLCLLVYATRAARRQTHVSQLKPMIHLRLRSPTVEALLLAWFAEHGRDLPWRRTRDPYAILVSEVMSQQTQVERVVPRWQRWLERWPTVEALAAAPASDAIGEWQGLGYNRRALALHRAAQQVAAHGWPDDLTELPGVGRYTADAVACFAFGRPVLPVDVNVRRVSERTGHDFSAAAGQALMDLGKTVCLARIPRCGVCPLAAACPSRGRRFEPSRRQGPFEGSFRQRRAAALRAVLAGSQPRDAEAVASLARDGLVRMDGDAVFLPE